MPTIADEPWPEDPPVQMHVGMVNTLLDKWYGTPFAIGFKFGLGVALAFLLVSFVVGFIYGFGYAVHWWGPTNTISPG